MKTIPLIKRDTICALASPNGVGAIALIRISGKDAISIVSAIFEGKSLSDLKTQSLVFGRIVKGDQLIDEVLVSVFRNPRSYTGEDLVEISCHASPFIINKILELLLSHGCRLAQGGEFSMRAFMNGKMDLSQAEAVADLIAAEHKAAHEVAMQQMRGGFSEKINDLRSQLIHFASLIELELDFSEEDVEFADRADLKDLVNGVQQMISKLIGSFDQGQVLKNGIPVAIIGEPNVGKSTLLNALLNEEKAIVSEIAGTTRDSIEDTLNIGGLKFRFIDTAGIRKTEDIIESIGIKRTFQKIAEAQLILYLYDRSATDETKLLNGLEELQLQFNEKEWQQKELILIANKTDKIDGSTKPFENNTYKRIAISALKKQGIEELVDELSKIAKENLSATENIVVSNVRHLSALKEAQTALNRVTEGLENGITGDFLAMDIRQAMHHLGEISGTIEMDRDILGNIFSRFCIGK